MKLELFGAWEAADYLGMTKQGLFHRRRNDPLFPPPEEELRSGPVWTRQQLDAYKAQGVGSVGRLNVPDARRALELGRDTFEFYATQHRAKVTLDPHLSPKKIEDTIAKAKVNEELVEIFQAVLDGREPTWPERADVAP